MGVYLFEGIDIVNTPITKYSAVYVGWTYYSACYEQTTMPRIHTYKTYTLDNSLRIETTVQYVYDIHTCDL